MLVSVYVGGGARSSAHVGVRGRPVSFYHLGAGYQTQIVSSVADVLTFWTISKDLWVSSLGWMQEGLPLSPRGLAMVLNLPNAMTP